MLADTRNALAIARCVRYRRRNSTIAMAVAGAIARGLTAGLDETSFEVALVPHTLAVTTLGSAEVGTAVNLEVDVLAKYVERLVGPTTMTP